MPVRRPWLVLALALPLALAGRAGAAADISTTQGYAEWAAAALASPPAGVRFLDRLEDEVIELAAAARSAQAEGAAPLERDPGLELVARAHALDMLERGYMDHVDPEGRAVGERVAILARRFVGGAGENLAEHDGIALDQLLDQSGPLAQKLVDGWLASPGHRANLLEPAYSHFGLAAAGRGERVVIVHVFGRRSALLAAPLPLEVEAGADLPLAFAPGAGPEPQKFAFAPPGLAVEDLVTLEVSSSAVAVGPGEYRLEFFFPSERDGYFEIVDGPLLLVNPG
jgi:uncharacterized protein YkwD